MTLRVTVAAPVGANTPFSLTVPGQEIWRVKAVRASASRAVGGTPNRAYTLTITDGTNTVVQTPADDAGTEPGTLTVTWANASPTAVASGTTGISVGPLSDVVLYPGYILTGTIVNAAAGDAWTRALVWWDDGIHVR